MLRAAHELAARPPVRGRVRPGEPPVVVRGSVCGGAPAANPAHGWRGSGVARQRRRRPTRRTAVLAATALGAVLVGATVNAVHHPGHRWVRRGAGLQALAARPGRRVVPARAPLRLLPRDLGALLPQPLDGLSAAALGGRVYLLGGAGPDGFSATIYAFTPPGLPGGPSVTAVGRLPQALHDGAAIASGSAVYFCGGGRAVGSPAVYRFTPGGAGGSVTVAGALRLPLSDLAGAAAGGHAVCLGGWTGALYSDAVFDPAAPGGPRLVGHLPYAVRYAAAAPLAGGVLVAGGRTAAGGAPSRWLQWLPPRGARGWDGAPAGGRVVGTLPQPLAYAAGAPLDGEALIIGGCGAAGAGSDTVWAVAAPGVAPRAVGRLPAGWCYGAAATVGRTVFLFGGRVGASVTAHVWAISEEPSAAPR